MKQLVHSIAAALYLGAAFAMPATADTVKLKEDARELGISVGQAYVCTPDDQKAMARADSEAIYDTILFGIDHEHAYIYAVAVGYGAATQKSDIDCKQIAARLSGVRSKMGLGEAE